MNYYWVAAENVLGLCTNVSHFKWSFGTNMAPSSRERYDNCAVRLRVEITPDLPAPSTELFGKYHYWKGAPGVDAVSYERRFLAGSRLRLEARGLLGPEPIVRFNRAYSRFVTHRFMNLHSAGYILTDLAGILLLRQGFAPLHCSAFKLGDATVVVMAPPNTGKTLTSIMACRDYGAKFLAEDLAITDGSLVYSVPWTSTFRYYSQIDRRWASRLGSALVKCCPPLELIQWRRPQPITDYLGAECVLSQASITHLVILESGEPEVKDIDVDEATRKSLNLNRYEFNYHKSPLVVAHEFFNPALDIAGACRAEEQIIRALVENAACRLVCRSNNAADYVRWVARAVEERGARGVHDRAA